MYKRSMAIVSTIILAISMTLSGCETTGQSAGLGAALGAVGGAIIGAQSGNAAEGAAIGAALGAGIGAVAGKIRKNRQQVRTAEQVQQEYGTSEGLQINLEDSSVSPSAVEPGNSVNTHLRYATVGTPDSGVVITESATLVTPEGKEFELDKQDFQRADGAYETELTIPLKKDAPIGNYTVKQFVVAEGRQSMATDTFRVEQNLAANLEPSHAPGS